MKRVLKYLMMISVAAGFTLMSTSCFRQDYMFFEDGEFDGSSFSDYDLMQKFGPQLMIITSTFVCTMFKKY